MVIQLLCLVRLEHIEEAWDMDQSNEASELRCVKEFQFVNRQQKPRLILGDTLFCPP
jgi:hypothetical protein